MYFILQFFIICGQNVSFYSTIRSSNTDSHVISTIFPSDPSRHYHKEILYCSLSSLSLIHICICTSHIRVRDSVTHAPRVYERRGQTSERYPAPTMLFGIRTSHIRVRDSVTHAPRVYERRRQTSRKTDDSRRRRLNILNAEISTFLLTYK